MEAIGSAATIIQLVSFTGEVLAIGYGYLAKVKNAPLELKNLLQEAAAIDALLEELEVLAIEEKSDTGTNTLQKIEQTGILNDCNALIKLVEASLKACQQIDRQQIRNIGKRMIWPFKAKETKETMGQLRKMREILSAAVVVDSAIKLKELERLAKTVDHNVILVLQDLFESNETLDVISSSINTIANDFSVVRKTLELQLREEEILAIKKWLYPDGINTYTHFEAALKLREPQTGNWMMNSKEFKAWEDSSQACLWIYGFAGCGKTIMVATIIDYLKTFQSDKSALVFFFCDRRDPSRQIFFSLLFSITKQLIESNSNYFPCLDEAKKWLESNLQKSQNQPLLAKPLTQSEYIRFARKLCSKWDRVRLVIDALDECSDIKEFASGLKELQHNSNIDIILTSRDEHIIRQSIYPMASQSISLQDRMNADIHTFLSREVRSRVESGTLKLRDRNLENQIVSKLEEKADGLILIAKLQLSYICELKSDRAIKDALKSLPSEIYATYDEMLYQLCSKYPRDMDDLKQILLWLSYSQVPLTVEQLAEIVSIRPEDESLDKSGIATDPKELLQCCGGFVTIRTDVADNGDYEDLRGQVLSIVTLSHASVEEYLKSSKLSTTVAWLFNHSPATANLSLAKKCLQYIDFHDFKKPLTRTVTPLVSKNQKKATLDLRTDRGYLKARISEYPFYDYACQYWPEHLRLGVAESPLGNEMRKLLKWFISGDVCDGNFISWQQIYHHDIEYYCPGRPALYYAIEFHITSLSIDLLPSDKKLDELILDAAPLHIAARCDATAIMEELIRRGASLTLNSGPETRAMSPLHFAAEGGHVEAISLLLSHGAPIDARSRSSSTPFFRAARSGSLKALQLLKTKGSDINAATWDGWTPLFEATAHGRIAVAAQLLEWGADPTITTTAGESALTMLKWAYMDKFFGETQVVSKTDKDDSTVFKEYSNGCLVRVKETNATAYSSTEDMILADIEATKKQPPGLKKWYPLLKNVKRQYYYLQHIGKDTQSAREREKDQRWSVNPQYIIKSSEFRDKENPFGQESYLDEDTIPLSEENLNVGACVPKIARSGRVDSPTIEKERPDSQFKIDE